MIIRSKAPLRISFGGGGTDIPPYCNEKGGVVLSSTIDKYAYVSIEPNNKNETKITSLDFNQTLTIKDKKDFINDNNLDLIKTAIKAFNLPINFDVFIHCDAKPGSGLATSSAITVAIITALQGITNKSLTSYEIAELAYFLERKCYGSKGGKQDQFASSFGGFNFIEFYENTTVVNSLRLSNSTLNELNYRLQLFDIGKTRQGPTNGSEQISNNTQLDTQKEIAVEMKKVLLKGELDSFGFLLNEAWQTKKLTHLNINNNEIDTIYQAAIESGAYGGKILGAAGGGFLIVYSPYQKKHIIESNLNKLGAKKINFSFDLNGSQYWISK